VELSPSFSSGDGRCTHQICHMRRYACSMVRANPAPSQSDDARIRSRIGAAIPSDRKDRPRGWRPFPHMIPGLPRHTPEARPRRVSSRRHGHIPKCFLTAPRREFANIVRQEFRRNESGRKTSGCYTECEIQKLEWRNWQTHGTQNPAAFTGHEGSTPSSSTSIWRHSPTEQAKRSASGTAICH
jgi:hypothetical protein